MKGGEKGRVKERRRSLHAVRESLVTSRTTTSRGYVRGVKCEEQVRGWNRSGSWHVRGHSSVEAMADLG